MATAFATAIALLASWLIGSIPTAYIVTKLTIGKDIRSLGSGNAGATNVFRALGARYAVPVFLFDFLKGCVPVLVILHSGFRFAIPETLLSPLSGAVAIAGHMFPVFAGWQGGKGVATGAGFITALYPYLFPACLAVFIPVFLVTRKMSLASIVTACSVPVLYATIAILSGDGIDFLLLAFLTLIPAIVIARHWRNIRRLANGTEAKLF